ncbi:oligosaccharide flippase family protein [Amnibacterium sp. CER49]|uniref:oligosaccharide flippase family protein n=1 Tax=Amnibacterium sp. CER49 TaxID=3039161 RepID=UPI00244B2C37|nr:oligosaccharide flippase family protein [Amnibacterium sp. CER49]MDH2443003.1 oligosaccharide flippase family protein [Amnibacterium sp. CER49]
MRLGTIRKPALKLWSTLSRGQVSRTLYGQWGRYALQIASLVVLTRLLPPSAYGIAAMGATITGLATVLSDLGLSLSALRTVNISQQEQSNLFWLNGAIGIGAGALVLCIAPLAAQFYSSPAVVAYLGAVAMIFPASGFAVQHRVRLQLAGRVGVLAYGDLAAQASGFAAAVAAALLEGGVGALACAILIPAYVQLLIAVFSDRWKPSRFNKAGSMAHHLRFGRNSSILQVLNYIGSNIDTVMLGRLQGTTATGLYNRAFQLVSLPIQQIATPLTRVMLPHMARAIREGRFPEEVQRIQRRLCWVTLPLLGMLFSCGPTLVSTVFGSRWGQTGSLVQVLAIGGAFQAAGYIYYWGLLALGRTSLLLLTELPGRALAIVGVVSVAPSGPTAVAQVMSMSYIAIWCSSTLVLGRVRSANFPNLIKPALAPFIAAVVGAVCTTALARVLTFHSEPNLVVVVVQVSTWITTTALTAALLRMLILIRSR